MICFQGPLICYITPEALPVTQTLYFSLEFFPRFFVGLCRICLCANVLNFEYWHLSVACKNWLCGYETWMKTIFSWMKNRFFCSQFSPQNTGNHNLGFWNSKILGGSMPPDPPGRRGLIAPCWYSQLLYSNLLATSVIIETPTCLNVRNQKTAQGRKQRKMGQELGMSFIFIFFFILFLKFHFNIVLEF